MDRTSTRLGGIVLVLAAVGALAGGILHGAQPGTVEAYAELGATWTASHVAIAVAGTLLAVSALFLAVRFAGSAGEGWALLGSGALLLGGVGLLAVGTIETVGFSGLAGAAEGGNAVAAQHAYLAASAVMTSLATAAGYLLPVAVVAYGVGMLGADDWPGWLGWAGIVIGAAALILTVTGITLPAAPQLTFYVLHAWIMVVGAIFFGSGGPAADAEPVREPVRHEPARQERHSVP